MINSFSDIFVLNFKNALVHFIAALFFVLSLQNFNFFFELDVRFSFILIFLFFWAIYKPTLFHPTYIFFLGFLYDCVLGLALGFHSFIFLIFYFIISKQRLFIIGQSYFVVLCLFSMACSAAYLVEWIFYSLIHFSAQAYMPVFFNCVYTIALFPVVNSFHVLLRKMYFTLSGIKKID